MPRFLVNSEHLIGFVAETTKAGQEKVKVVTKASVTSYEPNFHVWINHIHNLFFNQLNILSAEIKSFVILLHSDDTADVFLNDFIQTSSVKVNRNIQTGESVFIKDILDITDIQFPNIEIKPNDVVIYSFRFNWKFGLYFDFGRELNLENLSKELAELFKKVGFDQLIETTNAEINKSSSPVFILTEGKTDWQHLEHAKERLGIEIDITFDKTPDDRGDTTLLQMCKHFSRIENSKIIILIFDRDVPKTIKELGDKTINGQSFQDWGNNVYSFIIPSPEHRKDYLNVSIEFYYTDNEIRTKNNDGKRLFFDNELEKRIAPGESPIMVEIEPVAKREKEKKIYDQDVSKIMNSEGKQIALSKSNFAQNIFAKKEGFNNFDVTEFNKIFAIIESIIKNSTKKS